MELDQFMKEFAVDFLKEIIELFFPKLAPKLYFSQKKDLNKELYTEILVLNFTSKLNSRQNRLKVRRDL